MRISELIERLGRTVFEPPSTSAPDAGLFERDFFRRFLEEEVRKSLACDSCSFPDDEDNWLRIAVAHALLRAASALLPTHGCSE